MNPNAAHRPYVKTLRRAPLRRYAARRGPSRALVSARVQPRMSGRFVAMAAAKESGYVDLAQATRACDTTGTVTLVATIAQGAGTQQRVGKKVLLKSAQIRGSVFSGTTTTTALATVMLIYDKRPTGALPAITDILVTISSKAMNNDDNSGRFKIVRRWDWGLTGNSATPATGKEFFEFMEFADLKNMPSVYKSVNTGAIADIEEGALYLVTLGDVAAGTAAASSSIQIRTRFLDV